MSRKTFFCIEKMSVDKVELVGGDDISYSEIDISYNVLDFVL